MSPGDAATSASGDKSVFALALVMRRSGHYLTATRYFKQLHGSGIRHGNGQSELWGLAGVVSCQLQFEDKASAGLLVKLIKRGNRDELCTPADFVFALGSLAEALLAFGKRDQALSAVRRVLQLAKKSESTIAYHMLEGLTPTSRVLMRCARDATHDADELEQLSRTVDDLLQGYAQLFPSGGPQYQLFVASRFALAGKDNRARKAWENGIDQAKAQSMPLERGVRASRTRFSIRRPRIENAKSTAEPPSRSSRRSMPARSCRDSATT